MSYQNGDEATSPGGGQDPASSATQASLTLPDQPVSSTATTTPGVAPSAGYGVMALDSDDAPDFIRAHPDWKDTAASITDAPTLGDGLRAARAVSGQSLAELSITTRVHTRYLTALEQNDFSVLPSRVFAIGYVRAYASALGLDEQLAVERFKRESPDPSVPLQAPSGVAFQEVRRQSPRVIAAIALVAVAVLGWNVFQRVSLMRAPHPSDIASVPESWTLGAVPGQQGVVHIADARPAPPDQTTPALYITPGLEAQLTAAVGEQAVVAPTGPVQRAFNPRGAVYGASATASQVVLQARKAASLVVRMADGRVLFARQLAPGEAWRAPVGVAATVDVSDPAAFDVYLNGEHGGFLPAVLTPLAQLNQRAQTLARETAAQVAAQAEAARPAAVQAAGDLQQSAQTTATALQ